MRRLVIGIFVSGFALFLAQRYFEPEAEIPGQLSSNAPLLSDQPYLRAAHWFGEDWPVNFWNTDIESRARADFEKILADGFNTVVLLVPWPGFAPDPRSGQLDQERVDRLLALLRLADEMGLKTVLRISYAWDSLDERSGARLINLWLDEDYYQGWLGYVESVWDAVHEVPGFQFGFFSWEDLWAATSLAEADEDVRSRAAHDLGFGDWVIEEVAPERARRLLGSAIDSASDVILPARRSPGYELFLEFMNKAWIDRYFLPAQKRFPRLSMEIRIDADAIYDGEDHLKWFHHHDAWNLPGADWVTLYWAPSMGGENQGESLAPAEAASRLARWLDEVGEHAGPRQIFIGQFLVEDFTPGYGMNGRIPREQVPEFLELAESVLQERAGGIGLWTWTDYGHDLMANPAFFAGLEGWRVSDGVSVVDKTVEMETNGWIEMTGYRFQYHAPGGPERAELCVQGAAMEEGDAEVVVHQGSSDAPEMIAELLFTNEPSEQCVDHATEDLTLRFTTSAPFLLERISSIGVVQKSGMRNTDFSLKPVGQSYRALNASLRYRPVLTRERFEDGWMGQFWVKRLPVAEDATHLVVETHLPADWPKSVDLTVALDGQRVDTVPCQAGERHVFELPDGASEDVALYVEASTTHSPGRDRRELGCLISAVEAVGPSRP